jgi:hypothetical protein
MDLKFRMITECGIDKIQNVVIGTFQSNIQLNIPSSPYIYKHAGTHTHKIDITVFIIHTYIQKPLNGICDSFLTIRFHQSGKRDYYKSI